jgi:hypothetical protein
MAEILLKRRKTQINQSIGWLGANDWSDIDQWSACVCCPPFTPNDLQIRRTLDDAPSYIGWSLKDVSMIDGLPMRSDVGIGVDITDFY